jgi:hypothetical protein
MLNVIDEFTRACLAIRIGRKLNSIDVIDVLSDLFTLRGSTALLSMGEWLLRKLQRQAPGRAAQRRDLHHAETRPGS